MKRGNLVNWMWAARTMFQLMAIRICTNYIIIIAWKAILINVIGP